MKAALPFPAFTAAVMLGLAACAPAAKAPPAASPPIRVARPAPPRALPPTLPPAPADRHWMDAHLTPGGWIYQNFAPAKGRRALFSDLQNTYYFSLACASGPDGMMVQFNRTGRPAARYLAMTIHTETAQRTLTAERFGTEMIIASVPASDPLLDAMALSKGRFAVEVEGEAALYLPSHAEVSRVIEDCRG
jgi:hypothetical protein